MAKLTGVVDGGTLTISFGERDLKVRMHGIAIPPPDEKRPILQRLNDESLAFLRKYLDGGWVYLEFPAGKVEEDPDGFVPAYVYRGGDATFLNEKLVSLGLAVVNRNEKSAFTESWLKLQAKAKETRRGVWGSFSLDESGEALASGGTQRQYMGVGAGKGSRGGYVTTWILIW